MCKIIWLAELLLTWLMGPISALWPQSDSLDNHLGDLGCKGTCGFWPSLCWIEWKHQWALAFQSRPSRPNQAQSLQLLQPLIQSTLKSPHLPRQNTTKKTKELPWQDRKLFSVLNFDWILTEFWLYFDCILTTFWLHFDSILTEFWLLLTVIWLNFDCILTDIWLHWLHLRR